MSKLCWMDAASVLMRFGLMDGIDGMVMLLVVNDVDWWLGFLLPGQYINRVSWMWWMFQLGGWVLLAIPPLTPCKTHLLNCRVLRSQGWACQASPVWCSRTWMEYSWRWRFACVLVFVSCLHSNHTRNSSFPQTCLLGAVVWWDTAANTTKLALLHSWKWQYIHAHAKEEIDQQQTVFPWLLLSFIVHSFWMIFTLPTGGGQLWTDYSQAAQWTAMSYLW